MICKKQPFSTILGTARLELSIFSIHNNFIVKLIGHYLCLIVLKITLMAKYPKSIGPKNSISLLAD